MCSTRSTTVGAVSSGGRLRTDGPKSTICSCTDRWDRAMVDSEAGYELLFREEYAAVLRTVFLICHDREQAQDVTQEEFVQLFRHWRKVSRYDRPGAWVRRIAIRMTMQALKRERLRSILERDMTPIPAEGPIDVDVLNAISSLPPKQRAATVLFYFGDLPLTEVAEMIGCSHATARVHVQRARTRLANVLGEEVRDVP